MSDPQATPVEPLGYAKRDQPTFLDNSERATKAIKYLGLYAIFSIVTLIFGSVAIVAALFAPNYFGQWFEPGSNTVNPSIMVVGCAGAIFGIVILVIILVIQILAIVYYMMWQYRANANARSAGLEPRYSPGWSVGWWFIPLLNLVVIGRVLRDLWQITGAGNVTGDFNRGQSAYTLFILSVIVSVIGTIIEVMMDSRSGFFISSIFDVGSSVLSILFLYKMRSFVGGVQETQQPGSVAV